MTLHLQCGRHFKFIMKGPLLLTPRQDPNPVTVPAQIVGHLTPYQVDGIRYLYQQLFIKGHNVILNSETGINEARQIGALISVIHNAKSSLVFCKRKSLAKWFYEFANCTNLKVATVPTFLESSEITDHFDAILVCDDELKHFKTIPINKWFLFIVEDIDLLMKARYIKTTDAQFRIGITSHNFLLKPEAELQWNILKWINPKFDVDKKTFIETENYNKTNLIRPYPENWRRLTWFTLEKQKPTEAETLDYDVMVRKWCTEHKMAIAVEIDAKCAKRDTKKRLSTRNNSKERRPYKKRLKNDNPPVLATVGDDIKPKTKEDIKNILNVGNEDKRKGNKKNIIKIDTSDDEDFMPLLNMEEEAKKREMDKNKTNNIKIENNSSYDISNEDNSILNSVFLNNESKPNQNDTSKRTEEIEIINNIDKHDKIEIKNAVKLVNDEEENSILNSLFFDDIKIETMNSENNDSVKTDDSDTQSITKDQYNPEFKSLSLEKSTHQQDNVNLCNVETNKKVAISDSIPAEKRYEDSNWILDSLLASPEPETSKKEIENSDTEEEVSCAILDSLFF